jgi:hypothetical protein
MKRHILGILVICGLLGLGLAGFARASKAVDGDEPAIMVSPNVIVLAKTDAVTVHTNIPAVAVDGGTITLNGVPATAVWADDCGHVVARFATASLALTPGRATLTLSGAFLDGVPFAASDTVRVK